MSLHEWLALWSRGEITDTLESNALAHDASLLVGAGERTPPATTSAGVRHATE